MGGPEAQARWWAGVYGVSVTDNDGWFTVEGVPGMPVLTMDFVPVPEPKTVKNRIHRDVTVPDMTPLVAAGPGCCARRAAASAGTRWPARRETSSARSPGEDSRQPLRRAPRIVKDSCDCGEAAGQVPASGGHCIAEVALPCPASGPVSRIGSCLPGKSTST